MKMLRVPARRVCSCYLGGIFVPRAVGWRVAGNPHRFFTIGVAPCPRVLCPHPPPKLGNNALSRSCSSFGPRSRRRFASAAEDVLKRFAGVRVSASTVLRCTEGQGERLRAQLKEGRMVEPTAAEPKWTAPRPAGQPAAYVGLDAFSVPMQGPGASQVE